jgi:hypothetical protein
MPDLKISELTADPTVTGTEQVPVNDSGTTKRVTISQIKSFAEADALSAAAAAQATANAAATTAGNAQTTANSAATAASAAQSTANAAQSTANAAQSTANSASTAASNAVSTANAAASAASNAQSTANGAASAASNAQSTADAAQSTANSALSLASGALHIGAYMCNAVGDGSGHPGFAVEADTFALLGRRYTVNAQGISSFARIEFTARYRRPDTVFPRTYIAGLVIYRSGVKNIVSLSAIPTNYRNESMPIKLLYFGPLYNGDIIWPEANDGVALGEMVYFDNMRLEIMSFR